MSTLSKVITNDAMLKIKAEFSRLRDRCYLENAGASLYPQSLLRKINEDLMTNVYMNPHTDKYTKDCIEQIRYLILNQFNTNSSEYTVIFTSGTTQALKLTVESFQFASTKKHQNNCGSFVYLKDNHTSVLGLREIAIDQNAEIIHISHDDFLKYTGSKQSSQEQISKQKHKNEGNTLMVYPAQSSFNGYKYPLEAIEHIQDGCLNNYIKKNLCQANCNWYVLLDAASFVSTNRLDLSKIKPDFLTLSFYKIFGYPTGLGALIVKNSSAQVLTEKKYFGGGTVDVVLSNEDFYVRRQNLSESFEDGTQSFLGILALKHCFNFLNELIPKVITNNIFDTISLHTFYLAQDLYKHLKRLKHPNGVKAAVFYHDADFDDVKKQGGIVTFNLIRDDKSFIGYAEFQHMADLFDVNVRTGCFCNSGSCQRHLKATNKEVKDMYRAGHKCGDDFDLINGKPTGAIRASFGYYNTFEDVDKMMMLISKCFVNVKYKPPKRWSNAEKYVHKTKPTSTFYKTDIPKEEIPYANSPTKILDHRQSNSVNKIVLNEIVIFPIKSCGAFKIKTAWKISTHGFEFDRKWMIINDNGVCLTQKRTKEMCLIRPVIDVKRRQMILNFKGKAPISIPIDMNTSTYERETKICESKVCTDAVKGIDCGDEVADWISEVLGISYLRLIKQCDSDTRIQKRKDGDPTINLLSLSNQAQYLLINRASVRWLSSKIRDTDFSDSVEELTDRFRGNLIIDMGQELIETKWQKVQIGNFEFKVEGSCSRCQMVCINQETANKTVEPLRTISELFGGKIRFGIYLSYIGPVDGSKDDVLRNYSEVKPFTDDENISR